jgi:hypothetical protein
VTTDGLQLDPASVEISPKFALETIEGVAQELKASLPNRHAVRVFLSAPSPEASAAVERLFGIKAKKILAILIQGTAAQKRSFAESLMRNNYFLRRVAQEMPEETIRGLRQKYPATGFSWTRELLATALAGTESEKAEVFQRFFNGVMTFEQLVSHYSLTAPELSGVGTIFDSSALVNQLRLMQQLEPVRAKALAHVLNGISGSRGILD